MKLATRFRIMTAVSFLAYAAIAVGVAFSLKEIARLSAQQAVSDRINYLIAARKIAREEFMEGNARAGGQWEETQRELEEIVGRATGDARSPVKRRILANMDWNLRASRQLFELLRDHVESESQGGRERRRVLHDQLIRLSRSLVIEWNRLGQVIRRETDRAERYFMAATGGAILILMTLTTIGSLIIKRQVIQRLIELKSGARRLAEGTAMEDIPEHGNDELAELARGFNDMQRKVRAARASLEEANLELERKVRARTAELENSNRDLRQFAYVASHDLQEPLRVMVNYLQLLERKGRGHLSDEERRYVDTAVRQALHMRDLIQGVLDFSSIGSRLSLRPVNSADSLKKAVDSMQQAIDESGTRIAVGSLPTVHADDVLLTQLFQNLLSNAIKYRSEHPPRIEVKAEPRDGGWEFLVSDNGIGIAPAYREKIFGMFQRLHTKADYPGTGIGLAICKKIVDAHGGSISVESEPGRGSTFVFRLPAPPPPLAALP